MRYAFLLSALALSLSARPAHAKTIHVVPGDGTLQAAIDAAAPGDTLVATGTYGGPVVINKTIKLIASKPDGIQLDAGCTAPVGLTISADHVSIKGGMHVTGATETAIVIHDAHNLKTGIISATNTCETAATGMDLTASTRVTMRGGILWYFTTTALRIADLPMKAHVKFTGYYEGFGPTTTGLVVENVAPGADRKGADVKLSVLTVAGVTNGIVLTAADGVVIDHANVSDSPMSVTIDAASDHNIIRRSEISAGVSDAGNDTCWKGNNGHVDDCD